MICIKACALAVGLLLAASAQAQTFPPNSTPAPTPTRSGGSFTSSQPVSLNDFIVLNRVLPFGPGQTVAEFSLLPLSAFAGSADLAALRADMSAGLARADERATVGAALAAATDLQRPAAGAANRLGGTVVTYRDEAAAGFGYVRQSGKVDYGLAVGLARGAGMGKASIGVSW